MSIGERPTGYRRVLLLTIGTLGDLLPLLAVGEQLRDRGLSVRVATFERYSGHVIASGLGFVPLATDAVFCGLIDDDEGWSPGKGVGIGTTKLVIPLIRPVYELVVREIRRDDELVLSYPFAFGARIAQDHLGIPVWTVHPSAWLFQSIKDTQVYPRVNMRALAQGRLRRVAYSAIDRVTGLLAGDPEANPKFAVSRRRPAWARQLARTAFGRLGDLMFAGPVNALREEIGLPPVKGILTSWCHSPLRNVGLFPDWFAIPQTDWPPRHLLTGFVFAADDGGGPDEGLQRFLERGPAPVVFTFGSEKRANREAFDEALAACTELGARGVFISTHASDVPSDLPPDILYRRFAPFPYLFAHASCIVHHAGIGTAALAIRAAVPQILVPFSFDQPDNASRLIRAGIGEILSPARFKGPQIAAAINRLRESPAVAERCLQFAERVRERRNGAALLADEIAGCARGG